jgi:hypothetical protein
VFHTEDEATENYLPMHPSCLDILGLYITGRRNCSNNLTILDKDSLHLALSAFKDHCVKQPDPDYLRAKRCQDWTWMCRAGEEVLVADPGLPEPGFNVESNLACAYLQADIRGGILAARRELIPPQTAASLSARVKSDLFRKLPLELVFNISELLDDSSLFKWCTASWSVHSALRVNHRFWRHRITKISMPWLVELVPLLGNERVMRGVELKGLFCDLKRMVSPNTPIGGPLMRVANRRRVWDLCEVIAKIYELEEMFGWLWSDDSDGDSEF